jgi:predicted nucleic acid-binding protein
MNAVDTNILIYIHDPRDKRKQDIAGELVENLADGLLVWQAVCEFLAASRKLSTQGYDFQQAVADVRLLMSQWTVALPSWRVLDRGLEILDRHKLSYWDCMMVSACLEAGATTLYTEDLIGNIEIDGLKIVNPFA